MFENYFAINICSEDWDSVWEHAKEFHCVTKHAIQFKIICWLQITPYIRNKMDPKLSSDIDTLFGLFLSLCMIAYIVLENYCHHGSKQEAYCC